MTEGKCKAPWCDNNVGGWIPGEGYCCILHRSMHDAQRFDEELSHELDRYAGKAFELQEEVNKLREKNQVLTMAIQDHYDVWRTGNDRLRLAQNKWLWRTIDITEDDTGNAHG